MSDDKPKIGSIGWIDLSVADAGELRDFYADVAGWTAGEIDMGDYCDYMMSPPGADPVAGVCHARGTNAELPAAWLIYIVVEDLDQSISRCEARGGKIIVGPKNMGDARYCVIRDPAGAHSALYQP